MLDVAQLWQSIQRWGELEAAPLIRAEKADTFNKAMDGAAVLKVLVVFQGLHFGSSQ